MTLPILAVSNELEQAFPEVNWFTNEIPNEFITLPALPVGRITELDMQYTNYASANPTYYTTYIQVDLWVSDLKAVDKYYLAIDKAMRADNVQNDYSTQSYEPDLEGARRIIKRYVINNRVV